MGVPTGPFPDLGVLCRFSWLSAATSEQDHEEIRWSRVKKLTKLDLRHVPRILSRIRSAMGGHPAMMDVRYGS